MASHRAPKVSNRAAAFTVVGLTAGTAALVPNLSQAAPAPTLDQVRTEVNNLNEQSEAATQNYDAAQQQYTQLQQKIDDLQGQITTETSALRQLQTSMGLQASAQYESGGVSSTLQLAMAASPDAFLTQASVAGETASQDVVRLKEIKQAQVTLAQDQASAASLLTQQQTNLKQQAAGRATLQNELHQQQALLNSLTPVQRNQVENPVGSSSTAPGNLPPVSGRAAVAVAFAEQAVADHIPYVYAATGPKAYDCSGLTQAAWRAAGVSIERTSYEQYDSLPHVSEADLQPGDLLFFYPSSEGPQHVAIYVGNGIFVHAPHSGVDVQYGSLSGSGMPFVGAARP